MSACLTPVQIPVRGSAATYTPFVAQEVVSDDPSVGESTIVELDTTQVVPPSPTLDATRDNLPNLSDLGPDWYFLEYLVQEGEELGQIAANFGLKIQQIQSANDFTDGATIFPGQIIIVPQRVSAIGPALKLIPDSELVYGPAAIDFDVLTYANERDGFLTRYSENIDGVATSGPEILQRFAENYSINPRLLLALLEYRSGWVTQAEPDADKLVYPYGRAAGEGLFRQLNWTANKLNAGFYGWREGRLSLVILGDGTRIGLDRGMNAGTAAVQSFFAQTSSSEDWERAISADGFAQVYARMFGDPFVRAVEPLIPADLQQPIFDLPWERGSTWYFSGGAHASFGSGTPWGAIDFVPPDDNVGCYVSEAAATAVDTGRVVRTGLGQVMLDLDQDGFEQTGWNILFFHLDDATHALSDTIARRGTYLGRPSCDGGSATGAHLHLARKYNGVWISPVDVPFQLGDYVLEAGGQEYSGVLLSATSRREACDCRLFEINGVSH